MKSPKNKNLDKKDSNEKPEMESKKRIFDTPLRGKFQLPDNFDDEDPEISKMFGY